MLTLLTLGGGVALILFGARFLRKALDRLLGSRLERVMRRLANTRLRAFFAGLGIAVVAPSSTTVSVLAVQTVNAGHLPPRRVLPIMLGADVGLTVLVLLIALRLDDLAPALLCFGVGLFQFTRPTRSRGLGPLLIAVGLIFTGITTLSRAAQGLSTNPDLAKLMELAADYPVGLTLLAAALAVALQSSTATIGLAIALAASLAAAPGLDPAGAAFDPLDLSTPVVLGANLGMGVTLLVMGWSRHDTRRLALANLLFKLLTVAAVLLALPWVNRGLTALPLSLDGRIAAAHTGFNLVKAVLFLPVCGLTYRVVSRLTPLPAEPPAFGPKFIDNHRIEGIPLALGQARQEVIRVSSIVRSMLDDLWAALRTRNPKLAREVQRRDDEVDLLDRRIKQFLCRVLGEDADPEDSVQVMAQLRYVNELETIGDIIDHNLGDLVVKRSREELWFSDEGWSELDGFYQQVAENLLIAETAFSNRDPVLARQLLRHKQKLNETERRLRDQHFARLQTLLFDSHESSSVHLDILTHLKRINSAVTHVAYAILEEPDDASSS